jgi:hypothetical protein
LYESSSGEFCCYCPAWLGSLGSEPVPSLYVEHRLHFLILPPFRGSS